MERQLKGLKDAIKKEKETLRFVRKYIKNQLSNLDFYDYYGYITERQKAINNLDLSWQQYDEVKSQVKFLTRQFKIAKRYKLMR